MSKLELKVFGSNDSRSGYISWSPVPFIISNKSNQLFSFSLTNRSDQASISRVVFLEKLEDDPKDELKLSIGPNKDISLFVAGKFQPGKVHNGASRDSKDVIIEAINNDNNSRLGAVKVMIRVRKNANELSNKARGDFLNAIAKLNGIKVDGDIFPGPGKGVYITDFVEMHVTGAAASEHGDSHFLPWHRLYVLDLERQLQVLNPLVTIPYWKFDKPAPKVFTKDFMGSTKQIPRDTKDRGGVFDRGGANTPNAVFALDNPLFKWQIKNRNGIPRTARFNVKNEPANGAIFYGPDNNPIDFELLDELSTLALGVDNTKPDGAEFGAGGEKFSSLEGTPHGAAHVSFNGFINDTSMAPQDPLFFLLHCNVDRLWAKWQYLFNRHSQSDSKSYPYQNIGDSSDSWKLINSKQWPWNGGLSEPDGINPPGTRNQNFTKALTGKDFPDNVPEIKDTIDMLGYEDFSNYMGFAYDDVPYEPYTNQNIPT
ncbi:MAG: tyrosinase family protein [Bacteroidota bacterium]